MLWFKDQYAPLSLYQWRLWQLHGWVVFFSKIYEDIITVVQQKYSIKKVFQKSSSYKIFKVLVLMLQKLIRWHSITVPSFLAWFLEGFWLATGPWLCLSCMKMLPSWNTDTSEGSNVYATSSLVTSYDHTQQSSGIMRLPLLLQIHHLCLTVGYRYCGLKAFFLDLSKQSACGCWM